MAKYNITYSCGHSDTVQLYGKTSERERYVEWAGDNKLCPECFKARQAADYVAASVQDATANAAAGLPALDGSPKQIAWAESIRARALASELNKVLAMPSPERLAEQAAKFGLTGDDMAARLRAIHDHIVAARRTLETETSAKWWIDNRDTLGDRVRTAHKEAQRREFADVSARQCEEAARAKRAREAAQAAHMAAVLAPLAKLEASMLPQPARNGATLEVVIDGHTIKVAPRLYQLAYNPKEGEYKSAVVYDIVAIDGAESITYEGSLLAWVAQTDAAKAARRRINP